MRDNIPKKLGEKSIQYQSCVQGQEGGENQEMVSGKQGKKKNFIEKLSEGIYKAPLCERTS